MNNKSIPKWFSMLLLMLVAGVTGAWSESLTILDFSIAAGGEKEVAISLEANNASVYGIQTDITLSEGLTLVEAKSAVDGIDAFTNVVSSGATRIVQLSMNKAGAQIPVGNVINLKVKAADNFESGTIELSNTRLTIGTNGQELKMEGTSIAEVTLEQAEEWVWRDIHIDLTNANLLEESEQVQWGTINPFGIAVDKDGVVSRVAADADDSRATVQGKWHSNSCWASLLVTVNVEGPVKVTCGTQPWSDSPVTIKVGNETVASFSNKGNLWTSTATENVVFGYYKGSEPATLTIDGGGYPTYIAIEAVDPADIPNDATVTFDAANAGAEGLAPAAQKVEIGSTVKIPANTTLFIEGKTLTAWTDGTNQYKIGDEVTVNEDMTLTPVFTTNTVSFADRTTEVTALWDFQQKNGAVAQGIEGNTGIVVTQITIGNEAIDFPLNIDATNGKYNNKSWQDWAQINGGTLLKLPAYKGTVYSTFSMNDNSSTTFNGDAGTYAENVNTYTYKGSSEEMTINIQGGSYYRWLKAVYPAPTQEEGGFADIKVDLTNKNLLTEGEIAGIQNETNKTPSMNIGVAVASDGTISRVDKDADNAAAVLTGKWHSNEHGWSNFSATVPVEGTVKITFGTCAWGGDVTVKNADDATVATFNTNTGACYHNDKENNIISAYYKQDVATTLTISGGSYVPYFAVEKVDPKDVPSDVKFVFDASESGAEGVAPAEATVGIGKTFTMPKNFTLYKEGYTLTAWTDGTNNYAVGEDMTAPDAETVTLTPVFTQNEVSLADRTEPVTVKWNFRRDQGAPSVQWQNKDNLVWVAQAEVNGKTIDVATRFSTNPGKFNNTNWNDWCQLNDGTTFKIPSCKGATISVEGFNVLGVPATSGSQNVLTIDGQSDYTTGKTISYEIAGTAETVDVVFGNEGSYYRYIQAVLPVVESSSITQEKAIIDTDFQDWAKSSATSEITTNFSKENITFTYVNTSVDPTATNDGKFNSAEDPAYKGYIMSEKKEATVTTTAFKNITKVRYRHGATGSNRGWGLKMKVGDGEWETINDVTVSSPVWVEKEINKNNVQLQWYNLNTGQNAYMFELEVYANVEITAEQVTLLTAISPGGAGKVTVYPSSETYDKGTEVILTAEDNFGYDFVNWTNAAGEEVSTDAKFKYTVNSNETLTANFVAVETYELALTVDGTNDYMVTVSPAPEVVDGKWMYEAGTAVQLTANQYEGLVTFTNWSDGETNSSKLISMTEDVTLTAFYAQADIIAGWDFYKAGSSGRKADFAAEDNDADALSLVNTETGETSGWLDKSTEAAGGYESFKGAAVNWRDNVGTHHWQTKVNAEAFENINVQFQMLYNYNSYQKYNAEYSFDGETWVNFGSITMEGAKNAASFSEKLPEACNNKAELYIRMIADKNSEIVGTAGKDGNALAMFFITGTPKIVNDYTAPVLVSTVPADGATGVSASGKIVLTFDERVKVKADTKATLGTAGLTPVVSGKVVTFEYKGLDYATEYNFVLAGKTVGDLTDNMIQDDIEITFTTMERPTVDKKLYDAVVENVEQLVAAISAAQNRDDKNVRYRIFLKKGTYTLPRGASKHYRHTNGKSGSDEVVFHESDYPDPITYFNAQNVSIIGEDRDATIITNDIPADMTFEGAYGAASVYEGIGNSDVFQLSGNNSYWQDLTVSTGMEDNRGRDIAVEDKGTNTIWKNTKLHGYQDTWVGQNNNGLFYFEDGIIRGRTDYICGKGDAFYNRVEFQQVAGGYAAVPSVPAKIGWVMKDCTINGDGDGVDGNYTLGRPWGKGTPVALWIDTKMNVVPSAVGWNEMSGGWPARFAEYNSMTSSGSQIDLSGRKKTFGDGHENNPVLTAEEALEFGNLHNMFGDWDPTLATEQAPIVTDVKLTDNELSWTGSNYALLYAIVKNGSVIDFTTDTTYDISNAPAGSQRAEGTDEYQIRAANEMGGLNEASAVATETDGIETVNDNVNVNLNDNIYNLQGIRVNKAQKGVYIIGGRKVVVK